MVVAGVPMWVPGRVAGSPIARVATRQVFTGPLIGPLLARFPTTFAIGGYCLSFIIKNIIVIIIIIFMFKSLGCTFDLLHHLLHTGAKQSWRATAGTRRLLQAVNPYEHHMILHFESF